MMHNVVGIRGDGHGRFSLWPNRRSSTGVGGVAMQRAKFQQQAATFDSRVLDGISVAALLAAAVFFLWLIR
jgi:hypothetical protein